MVETTVTRNQGGESCGTTRSGPALGRSLFASTLQSSPGSGRGHTGLWLDDAIAFVRVFVVAQKWLHPRGWLAETSGGPLFSPACFGNLPPMDDAASNQQQVLDSEHLRLLSIFHYVKGGISAVFSCIPIIHVVLGLIMILAPHVFGHGKEQPPAFIGWLFVILGTSIILLGWTFAAVTMIAGRCIARRRCWRFCFIWACVQCLSIPFGTALGVCTILVLNRASVKELFDQRPKM
jgi:hypothetical protein